MEARPSASRKTFLRMSIGFSPAENKLQSLLKCARSIRKADVLTKSFCFRVECEHVGPGVMAGYIESQEFLVNFIQIQISDY